MRWGNSQCSSETVQNEIRQSTSLQDSVTFYDSQILKGKNLKQNEMFLNSK